VTSEEHKLRDIHSVESARSLECELEHLDFLDLKIAQLDDDILAQKTLDSGGGSNILYTKILNKLKYYPK
jgi:hypothetical protein